MNPLWKVDNQTSRLDELTSHDSDLKEAVSLMEQAQVRRVPVVDPSGRLAGIVSLADIALAGKKKDTAEIVREVSEPRYPH